MNPVVRLSSDDSDNAAHILGGLHCYADEMRAAARLAETERHQVSGDLLGMPPGTPAEIGSVSSDWYESVGG